MKVLPPAKADQPAALGRFYREARAAGSLDHLSTVYAFSKGAPHVVADLGEIGIRARVRTFADVV